jgi:hypothetical protein
MRGTLFRFFVEKLMDSLDQNMDNIAGDVIQHLPLAWRTTATSEELSHFLRVLIASVKAVYEAALPLTRR